MKKLIKLSVHEFILFAITEGDLVSKFASSSRAVEGIKAHQKIQKSRPEHYHKEVALQQTLEFTNFDIIIQGRIDGVYILPDEPIIIDEIKSTFTPLEDLHFHKYSAHVNQALTYAYIYSVQHELDSLYVQMTYYNLDSQRSREFTEKFTYKQLEEVFLSILKPCVSWYEPYTEYLLKRDKSISMLKFPYSNYRIGQREMAIKVYKAIENENISFFQAPTGIGKTLATLFPTIKSMKFHNTEKIFYLTAKTIGRTVAEKTMKIISENCEIKAITLTAKEKICFLDEMQCEPEVCKYACNFFGKVIDAMPELYQHKIFTREVIEEIAQKYEICPFEYSLQLSMWTDIIICDYNYVFDLRIYLKRFFEMVFQNYVFLIDESHNFPSRTREMYSATISKDEILKVRRIIKNPLPEIAKKLNAINNILLKRKKLLENNVLFNDVPDENLLRSIRKFLKECETWLAKNIKTDYRKDLLNLYFDLNTFNKISELFDHFYKFYSWKTKDDFYTRLYCLDPSPLVKEGLGRAKSTIFFSASLLPENYFKRMIIGNYDSDFFLFPSPFPRENLSFNLKKLSIRYTDRTRTLPQLGKTIKEFLETHFGNTLIFFPSYSYMNTFLEAYSDLFEDFIKTVQVPNMKEKDREDFLAKFYENENLKAFGILGGIFGEGIDLVGSALKNAIIVGTGLPQVNIEQELIKEYFEKEHNGFDFAYRYPGFNRVLQAVGRVIRTESDTGSVLLIDDRYFSRNYQNIFPNEWR